MKYRAKPELKRVLRDQGITVLWVGKQLGLSRQTASHIVNGHKTVSGEQALLIAERLRMPTSALWEPVNGA